MIVGAEPMIKPFGRSLYRSGRLEARRGGASRPGIRSIRRGLQNLASTQAAAAPRKLGAASNAVNALPLTAKLNTGAIYLYNNQPK
jgi:hypothetical protein